MGTMAKPAVYFLSESGLESSECCGLAQFVSDGHASATTKNQEGRLIYIYISIYLQIPRILVEQTASNLAQSPF